MNQNSQVLEALLQLRNGPVWDGNLVSKVNRDRLIELGYADKTNGFNIITLSGVRLLDDLGFMTHG